MEKKESMRKLTRFRICITGENQYLAYISIYKLKTEGLIMKLVFAIVHDDDERKVMDELNKNGFSATKLASTGGFLRSGNTTLLVGVDDDKVTKVIDIITKKSKSRKQAVTPASTFSGMGRMFMPRTSSNYMEESSLASDGTDEALTEYPAEVVVGGATIFVVNVERFEKV